jgi:hypothetical protein
MVNRRGAGNVLPDGGHRDDLEAVMAAQHWSDLSPRARRLIIVGAAAEGVLKIAALADMKRRPASEIRGSKWVWGPAMIVNSAGAIPIAYFAFGRRRRG